MSKLTNRIKNSVQKLQQAKDLWKHRHPYWYLTIKAIALTLLEFLLLFILTFLIILCAVLNQSPLLGSDTLSEIIILVWLGLNLLVVLLLSVLATKNPKIHPNLVNEIRAVIYGMAGLALLSKILVSYGVESDYVASLGRGNLVDLLACYIAFDTFINIIINELKKTEDKTTHGMSI